MILQGLTKIKSDKTSRCLSSEEVVTRTVCSLTSVKCIDRDCDKFGVKEAVQQLFDSLDEDCPLSYYQWNTVDGKTKKELIECSSSEAKEALEARLTPFSCHVYNIQRQYKEMRHLKENLKQDEIIIHEGFSSLQWSTIKMQAAISSIFLMR